MFTYEYYKKILIALKNNGYIFADYHNWKDSDKCVILRHDIDMSLERAVKLAELEGNFGIQSTFFVLLTSDFYNVFSKRSSVLIKRIMDEGHKIGLHFDESCYPEINGNVDLMRARIRSEVDVLEQAIQCKCGVVSMHRPTKELLDADIQFDGVINSYGKTFFKDFKYLSDSRRNWKEPIDKIICSGKYKRLHVLTHAFWYGTVERDIHDTIMEFVNSANSERYIFVSENITDINSIMNKNEVLS
ncbi:hypothetical protein [Butyrivibrio fibrisolvens]|uniref:hypothetical protein n=1 Tax=Butyrivibrio fibrisolvens TaxID=831 RepID=UPI0004075096|nr:hypothetical protein [Butyrivibrio fibrisolvens]